MSDNVVSVVAFGECRNRIYNCRKLNKNISFYKETTLHKLMHNIDKYLVGIDTVLLSPSCSSFDEFSSYEDRGNFFKKAVLSQGKDVNES